MFPSTPLPSPPHLSPPLYTISPLLHISPLTSIPPPSPPHHLTTSHLPLMSLPLVIPSYRTVITVIELLAAVCLVKGGHDKIMEAVDNFKKVNGEQHRFQKLVQFFMASTASPDFRVACMNFINVIVHSAEDMNLRVHLQYEFTLLGLDDFLEVKWESLPSLLGGGEALEGNNNIHTFLSPFTPSLPHSLLSSPPSPPSLFLISFLPSLLLLSSPPPPPSLPFYLFPTGIKELSNSGTTPTGTNSRL